MTIESRRDTCVFCGARWGKCSCKFDPHGGFLWRGSMITEPCVSECGRFFVDPEAYYGATFVVWRDRRARALRTLLFLVVEART
jgi:hypothetical protein